MVEVNLIQFFGECWDFQIFSLAPKTFTVTSSFQWYSSLLKSSYSYRAQNNFLHQVIIIFQIGCRIPRQEIQIPFR